MSKPDLYRNEWRIEPAYIGFQWSHVGYDGPEDRRIGGGSTVEECERAIDDWIIEHSIDESEFRKIESELEETQGVLQRLYDKLVVDDSYGVPGSDFSSCNLCGAGGSPGAKFEHDESCAVLEAEQLLFNYERTVKPHGN